MLNKTKNGNENDKNMKMINELLEYDAPQHEGKLIEFLSRNLSSTPYTKTFKTCTKLFQFPQSSISIARLSA